MTVTYPCLIPKTMKGKELLKRILFGKLNPLPPEITDDMVDYSPPIPIPHDLPDNIHKVLFAVGKKVVLQRQPFQPP